MSLVFSSFTAGCHSGKGGNAQSAAATQFVFGTPILTHIAPEEGCCGDVITLSGFNFAIAAAQNHVSFLDKTGRVKIPGQVLDVTLSGADSPLLGTATSLCVIVPTGVRTGSVELIVMEPDSIVMAGAAEFAACPQMLGFAIGYHGDKGNLLVLDDGTLITDSIEFYGFNFESVNGAAVVDAAGDVIPLGTVAPFAPPVDRWIVPAGTTAITVPFPESIAPPDTPVDGCEDGTFPLIFRLAATLPSGSSYTLPEIEVQFVIDDVALIPASITGVLLPSGVRSGEFSIRYTLYEEPAMSRYDVIPEFFDAAQEQWIACKSAVVGVGNGTNVVPAGRAMHSTIGALIGPGSLQTFVWDTRAPIGGIPNSRAVTRLRLQATDPEENLTLCPTTIWESGPIAIDNSANSTGSIREDFVSAPRLDPDFAGTALLAPEGNGRLVGSDAPQSVFGDGTTHLVLLAGADYTIDTDFGTVTRDDLANPQDLFLEGNPGAELAIPEFHVATVTIESGAGVTVRGSNPLVFRCSGTGDPHAAVAQIDGVITLDGKAGAQGTAAKAGAGGAPGAGGFRGGDGGEVITDEGIPGRVIEVTPAEDGEGPSGGTAGSTIAILAPNNDVANPKAGCGGGAGHLTAGGDGVLMIGSLVIQSPVGRGGEAQGDAAITILRGGGGGGGGGGAPFRSAEGEQLSSKFGGGGGGGGGAFRVVADGSVAIGGSITVNGGIGEKGSTGGGAAPGGGGSGGSILIQATALIAVDSNARLLALGAEGGKVGTTTRGGFGAPGRIRIEAQIGVAAPGIVTFAGVQFGTTVGVSTGMAPEPADAGSAADGPFDLSNVTGTVLIDTDTGDITGPAGIIFLGDGDAEFHFSSFVLPQAVTIRGQGTAPLIIRVSGDAQIDGTIDLSGAPGGQVDLTGIAPIAGAGGSGGPGGGQGGGGGHSDGVTNANGSPGELPLNLPADLAGDAPPLGAPDNTDDEFSQVAVPATGGESRAAECLSETALACSAGHGGGGGYAVHGNNGASVQGAAVSSGKGGSRFGTAFLLNPLTGEPLMVGGTGGAGGGGNSDDESGASHTPGTGGGGAGGYIQISVGGFLRIGGTARIIAEGGDAFQAPTYGGNGGGGAGGGIKIQGNGFFTLEAGSPSGLIPIISALGGSANLTPTADFDGDGIVDYAGNGLSSAGGNGAAGRIRIEGPAGFTTAPPTSCGNLIILYTAPNATPAIGICPAASFAPFTLARQILSEARSLPIEVVQDSGVRNAGASFGTPTLVFSPPQLAENTRAKVLYEGARESLEVPGTPDKFYGLVDDPALLDGAEYLRMHFLLFADAIGGAVPAIDSVEIPITSGEP